VQAVSGVFLTQADAHRAVEALRLKLPEDKITLLMPGDSRAKPVPVDATEEPGMGKALGAVVGAAGGFSGGILLVAAMLPGVGTVTAAGLLGAAVLGAAGGSVGAVVGKSLENFMTEGLPEDEIFVYEDALRHGRSVVIALAEDAAEAPRLREIMRTEGAESIDAARQRWWIGLRSAEREHYSTTGRDFKDDEFFYRLGFEAALHARSRCQEFDQVSAEMARNLEELERQYPGVEVAEPYSRGYQRGRDYYQRFCDESKASPQAVA
jgi:hypothetical protein